MNSVSPNSGMTMSRSRDYLYHDTNGGTHTPIGHQGAQRDGVEATAGERLCAVGEPESRRPGHRSSGIPVQTEGDADRRPISLVQVTMVLVGGTT